MKEHQQHSKNNKPHAVANSIVSNQPDQESEASFVDNRKEAIAQRKLKTLADNSSLTQNITKANSIAQAANPIQKQSKPNSTGLPDSLKSGIENLSGYSMDDVKVHRNSSKPTQLQAHAYAQGTDIHLAPGQEKHLPHEAWHVVQQKQGRVAPTAQMKGGIPLNNDASLEAEADAMGNKATQFKTKENIQLKSATPSNVVQRNEATEVADSRVNDLVQRVLGILKTLLVQGENWEAIYGKKGDELGKTGVKKIKSKLLGGSSKKGASFKEKIMKEALKRWWESLEAKDKAKIISEVTHESVSFASKLKNIFSFGSSEKKEEEEEHNSTFMTLVSEITLDDVENGYEAYKQYKTISGKIKEFEEKTSSLAGELGASVGEKVGEVKNKKEFEKQFKQQQKPYKVAQLEFDMLKDTLKDDRYKDELSALKDALETRLQGPSTMINSPSIFSDKERTESAYEACNIAYDNLKMANIFRNTTKSGLAHIKNYFKAKKEELIGKSSSEQEKTEKKQEKLINQLKSVTGASWSAYTKGIFKKRPKGVEEVKGKLTSDKSNAAKLGEIKQHLIQPDEDLEKVEDRLSTINDQLKGTGKKLKEDLTVDKGLKETRTLESTEKYGNKQLGNSSQALNLGAEKVRLELKRKDLKKQIKSKYRDPLTQLFYDALKNLNIDNTISLIKTIQLMKQIENKLK